MIVARNSEEENLSSVHASHSHSDGGYLYFTFAGQGTGSDDVEAREEFYRHSWSAVMAATRRHRGSISQDRGIGLVRSGYLADALGEGFSVLEGIKATLDPVGILNPGKLGLSNPFGPSPWPAPEVPSAEVDTGGDPTAGVGGEQP